MSDLIYELAKSTARKALSEDTKLADKYAASIVPGDIGNHLPIDEEDVSMVSIEDKEVRVPEPEVGTLRQHFEIEAGSVPPSEAQVFVTRIINNYKKGENV